MPAGGSNSRTKRRRPRRSASRRFSACSKTQSELASSRELLERYRVPPPPRNKAHRTDWVNGASMMIRREVFETVGLMDEEYFLYFEETDFCRRVVRAGWPIWHVPASRVVHLEGQSTGVTGADLAKKPRPKYWFDSRARYFRKNLGAGLRVRRRFDLHRLLRLLADPPPPPRQARPGPARILARLRSPRGKKVGGVGWVGGSARDDPPSRAMVGCARACSTHPTKPRRRLPRTPELALPGPASAPRPHFPRRLPAPARARDAPSPYPLQG